MQWEDHFTFVVSFPKSVTQSRHENTENKPRFWNILQNFWLILFKIAKFMGKKEKVEKLSQSRGEWLKSHGAKCSMVSWKRKGH